MINTEKLQSLNTKIDYRKESTPEEVRKDTNKHTIFISNKDLEAINTGFSPYIGPGLNHKFKESEGAIDDVYELEYNCKKLKEEDLYIIEETKNGNKKYHYQKRFIDITHKLRPGSDIYVRTKGKNLTEEQKEHINKNVKKRDIRGYKIENGLMGKERLGEIKKTGDAVIYGQRNLKTGDQNRKQFRCDFSGDPDGYFHITNQETINPEKTSYKQIEEAFYTALDLISEVERLNINLSYYSFQINKDQDSTRDYGGDHFVINGDIKYAYGKELKLSRKYILNRKIKLSFSPFSLNKDFIDKYNYRIKEIILINKDYMTYCEEHYSKALIEPEEQITDVKFRCIIDTLLKNVCLLFKQTSALTLDTDYETGDYGRAQLCYLNYFTKGIDSEFVRNKTEIRGSERRNHGGLYFYLHDYYKTDDIKYLSMFFKGVGLNDVNHNYYITKNPVGKQFDLYLNENKEDIFDIIHKEGPLKELLREFIVTYCSLFGIYLNDYKKTKMGTTEGVLVPVKEITEKIYKNLRNIMINHKYNGFNITNFKICRDFLIKEIQKDSYIDEETGELIEDVNIDEVFNDNSYFRFKYNDKVVGKIFRKPKNCNHEFYKEMKKNEKIITQKQKKKRKLVKKYEKKEKINLILTDRTKNEDNYNFNELYDEMKNLKKYVNSNHFKNYYVELNTENRYTKLNKISYLAGISSKAGFHTSKDWVNFILKHFHICNSDGKWNREKIIKVIKHSYMQGYNKRIERYTNQDNKIYSYTQSIYGNLTKTENKLLKDCKIVVKDFILGNNKEVLKRHLKPHGKKNPHIDAMLKIFDLLREKNYNKIKEILINEFKYNEEGLNENEILYVKESINYRCEFLTKFLRNQILSYNFKNRKNCNYEKKYKDRNYLNDENLILMNSLNDIYKTSVLAS